jgi:hypothetical protein
MRCERYWQEGALLVEQGRQDPHREDCLDCRREHEARGELVRAFRLVGAQGGDPRWQARVWWQIANQAAPPKPWAERIVPWATALAAACALVIFVSSQGLLHRDRGEAARDVRPRFDIVPSEVAMRSTSAGIGDRVRLWVGTRQEARIYRAEKLLLRCTPAAATPGCTRDDGGVMAEYALKLPGDYQLVIVTPAGTAIGEPAGSLDGDLAAITAAGGTYRSFEVPVR